ncbi:MAG: DUF393 domain-containing protein [Planctomycetes bacterium]|nr:DUF393 domain-containing protein [Planctomycetota bacterium]
MGPEGPFVVCFDGVCNLCNSAVDFIVRRDRARRFRYTPLGSNTAERLLPDGLPEKHDRDSFVLIDDRGIWVRSDAALRVARHLTFPWSLARVFLIVPRPIRDAVYRWIARHRYEWFGKRDHCRVPTEEERTLFWD